MNAILAPDELRTLSDTLSNFATALAVLVGGLWALWKFGIRREAHGKIEFDLELQVLGQQGGLLLLEIAAVVTNKGLVRHELKEFDFELLYLPKGAPIERGDADINKQVRFRCLFDQQPWVSWEDTFVDPNVRQRYAYLAPAPADARFLLVRSRFKYADEQSEFHKAQRAWAVDLGSEVAPYAGQAS
jgi:hypothetical protein